MPPTTTQDSISAKTAHAPAKQPSRSFYPLTHRHYHTDCYGEITPELHLEAVADDNLILGSASRTRSLSLSTPQFSDLYEQKDYFAVPVEAILPLNWSKVYTNPITGDDVVAEDVNCVGSIQLPGSTLKPLNSAGFADWSDVQKLRNQLNFVFVQNLFLSRASLGPRLGYNFPSLVKSITFNDKTFDSFDLFMEELGSVLSANGLFSDVDDDSYKTKVIVTYLADCLGIEDGSLVNSTCLLRGVNKVSLIRDFIRTFTNTEILPNVSSTESTFFGMSAAQVSAVVTLLNAFTITYYTTNKENLNMLAIAAYQICCAHYFTKDQIDYIYSAELYRDLMRSLSGNDTFSYNGVNTLYDSLSGHYIKTYLQSAFLGDLSYFAPSDGVNMVKPQAYLQNLFCMRRSLRFVDKFVNARKTPLALGSTDVTVQSNAVNIVDVTRGIQMQRFLNLVNKTGRKFEEYVGKIFGRYVAPDYHNPSYLGRFRSKSSIYETENTADAQMTEPNSITSRVNASMNNKGISVDIDRPTIILGLKTYDMTRAYIDWLDRCHLHVDRFDFFLPTFQHIGDQAIFLREMGQCSDFADPSMPFGYEVRNGEYKSIPDYISGGFRDFLKSWILAYQGVNVVTQTVDGASFSMPNVISSDFIRSIPAEMDQFFISLQNYSTAGSFHFIVETTNIVEANRPIIVNPQILG